MDDQTKIFFTTEMGKTISSYIAPLLMVVVAWLIKNMIAKGEDSVRELRKKVGSFDKKLDDLTSLVNKEFRNVEKRLQMEIINQGRSSSESFRRDFTENAKDRIEAIREQSKVNEVLASVREICLKNQEAIKETRQYIMEENNKVKAGVLKTSQKVNDLTTKLIKVEEDNKKLAEAIRRGGLIPPPPPKV